MGVPFARIGAVSLNRQARERTADALLALAQQRIATEEVTLVEADEALEARLEGRVVGRDVDAPQTVGLLEPQRVERAVAEVHEPQRLAGFEQEVVQDALVLERMVELEAELAHVRHAQREHGGGADSQTPRAKERERCL